ncbi:hypothetical protein N9017_00330 [Akkermansiaceae bacterium]|nr:hypothetical protein [Akkermansiaceae bacterium]
MRKSFVFLGSLVLGLCGIAQGDLNDGLIAYYPFNGNANDESGNGNNGVVNGATLTSDRFDNTQSAYQFNNNSIKISNISELNGPFTLSLHFMATNIRAGNAEFLFASNTYEGLELHLVNNNSPSPSKAVKFFGNDRSVWGTKEDVFNENEWFHLTCSYDPSSKVATVYSNGQAISVTQSRGSLSNPNISSITLGSRANGSHKFIGKLDDIRIYNRALSAQEVATLHAEESNQFRYQIIEGNFTWQEATADAEAKGGRLAVLDTQEKIDAANAYLEELGERPHLWIGLTDEEEEGNWKWVDGTSLEINNWSDGEPNNSWFDRTPENYAVIASSSSGRGLTWNDLPGGSSLGWNGSSTGSYLLEILVQEPAPPVVELNSFYESNPQEEIVLDATPTEGFPDTFTYQWSFNDQPIPAFLGGAQPTFSLLGDQSQDGTWKVVVSNTVGTTEASFEYRVFVDNDSDGLSNYREENFTLTNPDLADSDSDGLSDPDELSIHGTDPNIADVDEDGLNDSEEIAATTDPSVADTDNDGLSDGAEVKTYASNPKSGDTDNDGIADAAELAAGLDINTAESIADAVAFLTQELANRPPVDGFEDALIEARASGRNDVTTNPSQYDLYDKATYDAVVADRDSRPTLAEYALIVEDRDSRPTLQAYNAVVADRDSRPTKEVHDAVIAERDARVTLEEVKDGRLGSVLLLPDTATNKVKLRFCIEESDELGAWTSRTEEAEVDIPLAAGKRFFRFLVKEDE